MRLVAIPAGLFALFVCIAAYADVMVSAPEPDFKITFSISPSETRDLTSALLDFASEEHLRKFGQTPRAVGKMFFLMFYGNSTTIVAEQRSPSDPVEVECRNADRTAGEAAFEQLTDHLVKELKRKWPLLKASYKTPSGYVDQR